MLEFLGAVYNEESTLLDLISHVFPYVDRINFVDDGSTDRTGRILEYHSWDSQHFKYKTIDHTGLPETVKKHALQLCNPESWVVMLDADERLVPGVFEQIKDFVSSPMADDVTHVWFTLHEYIDGNYTGKTFAKCRLFRARDAHFSDTVHVSDWFDGDGANFGWVVKHAKTKDKQVRREKEYIETYKKLISEGKMTLQQAEETMGNHYFVRENLRGNTN